MLRSQPQDCARGNASLFVSRAVTLCTVVLMASCAGFTERSLQRRGIAPVPAPADFPAATYGSARAHGDAVYAVDTSRTLVTIVVRRGGTLVGLGHDHVVASRDVAGFIDATAGRANVYAPLDRLTVDEPALRHEAHFDKQPSAADVSGTRVNMLERVLHVEEHPYVEVAVRDLRTAATAMSTATTTTRETKVDITLNGVTRPVQVPMTVTTHGDDLEVTGRFAIDQTDFALVPMSLFGGAITVENRLELSFTVIGRPIAAPSEAAASRAPR